MMEATPRDLMGFDRVDSIILRELYRWDADNLPRGPLRVSLIDLAARTGLHRNTIQARLTAMKRGGILEGMVLEPRPTSSGLVRSGYLFEGPRFRDIGALQEVLAPFPSVSSAVLCPGFLFLHLWHDMDQSPSKTAKAVAEELGATRFIEGYVSTKFPPHPADGIRPTPLEARMMLALRRLPSRSMAAVAREVRVTVRTAERRARNLIERGGSAMVPRFRPGRVEGSLLVEYVAWEGDERAAAGLANAFPDRIVGPFGRGQVSNVLVAVKSVEEMEERRWTVERLSGIGPLAAYLIQDILYPPAFESWLRVRVESVQSGWARKEVGPS